MLLAHKFMNILVAHSCLDEKFSSLSLAYMSLYILM